MSEGTRNEPPKDTLLGQNRAIGIRILEALDYSDLATIGPQTRIIPDENMDALKRAEMIIKGFRGYDAPIKRMVRVPVASEARKVLTLAWYGSAGHRSPVDEVIDFRIVEPGSEITRSQGADVHDKKQDKISYYSNTQETEQIIRRMIVRLGLIDGSTDIDALMREFRRTGSLELRRSDGIIFKALKPAVGPEVKNRIDAAYRIQIERAI